MGFFYVLNYLYCMKVKSRLNEALGVPEGILEVAEEIVDKITKFDFKYNIVDNFEDYQDNSGKSNEINTPFKIGDLTFKKISIVINVMPYFYPGFDKLEYAGASTPFENEMVGIGKFKNVKQDSLVIIFNFYCPGDKYGNPTISDKQIKVELKYNFIHNMAKFISVIAHELKHNYDTNKKPYDDIIRQSKFQTSMELSSILNSLSPIDEVEYVFYSSYFVSVIENLVRPTEVMSLIRTHQITKKDFLNFIKSNETYKTLNKIKNFTANEFYYRLFKNLDKIRKNIYTLKGKFGYNFNIYDYSSSEYIIKLYLYIMKDLFEKHSIEFIKSFTYDSNLFDNSENRKRYFQSISDKIKKNIKPEEFFKSEIENNAKKADLAIRKLAKLYAMAK